MSHVAAREPALLKEADAAIRKGMTEGPHPPTRLEVLEAASSRLAGWTLSEYWRASHYRPTGTRETALAASEAAVLAIRRSGLHPTLALSLLAGPEDDEFARRRAGGFYTDSRLACFLASDFRPCKRRNTTIIDPACGSAMLLAASVLQLSGGQQHRTDRLLRSGVFGADRSPHAVRAARLVLMSLTPSLGVLADLDAHIRLQDSLICGPSAWQDVAPGGFDLVVGNPPWEKLKVSRHEHLRVAGVDRHYGDDYAETDDAPDLQRAKDRASEYGGRLAAIYRSQGSGEPDLYKAFFELMLRLVRPGGEFAILVPAGLIRARGTCDLRGRMFAECHDLRITVLENGPRYFAIDTRFKFLAVKGSRAAAGGSAAFTLQTAAQEGSSLAVASRASIPLDWLRRARPDLTVPEVRGPRELSLFKRMSAAGVPLGSSESPWRLAFSREVDMSRARPDFRRQPENFSLPLIEGRSVHQYRFGAKTYVSGTGRSAVWDVNTAPPSAALPQFWIPRAALSEAALARAGRPRIGFCDVTGQTNERTVLAALIPAGVVCGNKVPTIEIAGDDQNLSRARLWIAIANSFAFDWLVRRTITTSLNYFVLLGAPFPPMPPESLPARQTQRLADDVFEAMAGPLTQETLWQAAQRRAKIEAQVFVAYGLELADVRALLKDFPLVDRGQPALPHEAESTITRDLVLSAAHALRGDVHAEIDDRVRRAKQLGAVPFVPAEYAEPIRQASRRVARG